MVSVRPLYPAMSSSNSNNDTISDKSTPWSLVKARVHVSVPPQSLNDVQAAATRQAYANLLLRYNTDLGGVVAAIKGALKLDPSPKIIDASPFLHVSATATMLLFSPKPGCVLRGVVNYVGPDHVGMSVHGVFHAVLPIDDAAPFYRYAGASERCWRYQYNVVDEDSNETNSNGENNEYDDDNVNAQRNGSLRLCSKTDIYMDATIRFVVTSVKSTKSGLFQVLASLKHTHESHRDMAFDESTPGRNTPSTTVLLGVVQDDDDDDDDDGGGDDDDVGDSMMDTDTNAMNSYLHHHQGHNYHKHKRDVGGDGFNLDMNVPNNNKKSAFDRTDPDGDNNDDASENENEDSGPTGESSPTSSLLEAPHQTPPSMPHGVNMRSDKLNNGVEAKSPSTTSPKMIARVTAKRSLFQRSGGFGSAFGSAFSGQRPSTTVAVNDDAVVTAGNRKDTTTTVAKAQSFDGLATTAGGKVKMSDDDFINEKKTSGRAYTDRDGDDVDEENNNNNSNVNKNVNNEVVDNDSVLTLSEKSRQKREKKEKKRKKKEKKEKHVHKENRNDARYFGTEHGDDEREVVKAKDVKPKGKAKDKGQSKVDVNVDNDEDEDNSNISGVLTQLDASAARKQKTEAVLKTYNQTRSGIYDDDGNEMDEGGDEVLVPETQEEEEDLKQPYANVTQISQSVSAKARKGEDTAVMSSLSPVVKSQKKKKVSKSKTKDRMTAGDDSQREQTRKRKRKSVSLSPGGDGGGENDEGGNNGMAVCSKHETGEFSHTTEQQRHKKKRKKQTSSTNSAVQLHRGRSQTIG